MDDFVKAKRGDLAVIVSEKYSYNRFGIRVSTTYTAIDVCEVTNVYREGIVKKVRRAGSQGDPETVERSWPHCQTLIVSKADVDVPAILAAVADLNAPIESTAQVKDLCRAHKKVA
jgi:hypothetical protein